MKRELNIDNVVYIINKQEKFGGFTTNNLKMYKTYTKSIMDYFYDEINLEEFDNSVSGIHGSFCKLNEDYSNKDLYDINLIEFISFYPNIILKLWKNGEIKFSSPEFAQFYEFIVLNKKQIYLHPDTDENTKIIIRFIINYLFGFSQSNIYGEFIIDKPLSIIDYAREINQEIFINYNSIYNDIDTIFIEEVNDNLKRYIDSLELPYTIIKNIDALFFKTKKYVYQEDGIIKLRGLQPNRKNRPIQYEEEINKFENNLKIRIRNKKIQKLIKKLQHDIQ